MASLNINGEFYKVGNEFHPATSLLEYMRETGVSRGTKGCCYEGGCGVCLVAVKLYDPISETKKFFSINSCCLQLYTCDGLEITTIEGLGSTETKIHPIQDRIAKYNGIQCGFCTPGQVMNMYGLLKEKGSVTMKEVEDSFDSTTCRCTGYRPILDAMKSFSVDAPGDLPDGVIDIEEADKKICRKSGKICLPHKNTRRGSAGHLGSSSRHRSAWLYPRTLSELSSYVRKNANRKYRFVFGNTGFGVHKEIGPWNYDILIDLRGVTELYSIDPYQSDYVSIGANVSLNALIEFFSNTTDSGIVYKDVFLKHLKLTASKSIRNMCSWAGNLMLKHLKKDFQSDIFTILETIDAKINIVECGSSRPEKSTYSLGKFLELDMHGKFISSMILPKYPESSARYIETFRTSHRLQLCASHVVSGFNFEVDKAANFLVLSKPSIIVLGINNTMIHAESTEKYLVDKELGNVMILKGAISCLASEIEPSSTPLSASPGYRKAVAVGHFYKFVLNLCKTICSPRCISGALDIERPIMTGKQDYNINESKHPVAAPVLKTTAEYFATGEVKFIGDLPPVAGELHGALVLSTKGNAQIQNIDASAALKMPGVVGFIQASDIPAGLVNNWRPNSHYPDGTQELLASSYVLYAGQPIGIVLAEKELEAHVAVFGVDVKYTNMKMVVSSLEEAVSKKSFFKEETFSKGNIGAMAVAAHRIKGRTSIGDQYHYHLENQISICTPNGKGGMDIVASTQWPDATQETVAQILNVPSSDVTVEVEQIGGAFGGKIFYNMFLCGACALSAHLTNRTVRMSLDMHTNMRWQGKRTACIFDYEVGFDDEGTLLSIDCKCYSDAGCLYFNWDGGETYQDFVDNAYFCPNWKWTNVRCKTNKPVSTSMRGVGSSQAIFAMECIMDHIATVLKKDPLEVRRLNLFQKEQKTFREVTLEYCNIKEVVDQLYQESNFALRQANIFDFNFKNRWKKRGIHLMPLKFGVSHNWPHNTNVSVYQSDGSVAIAAGGVDIGQGIFTKAIQCCAYELGIPMEKIRVKKTSTVTSANTFFTAASTTSELVCYGVIQCCKQIVAQMAPVKKNMPDATWEEVVRECYKKRANLTGHFMSNETQDWAYFVYGACVAEVELDVLTGQYQISQVDMLYDCGESLNPVIDMGQTEGGFIQGIGLYLLEESKYDINTAQLLTDGSWTYKVPLGKDLPVKFNVTFLRDAPNLKGVLGAKATGEPPLILGQTPLFALRRAIESARFDAGAKGHFVLTAPATTEKIYGLCGNSFSHFIL